jgi:hypothetical protein
MIVPLLLSSVRSFVNAYSGGDDFSHIFVGFFFADENKQLLRKLLSKVVLLLTLRTPTLLTRLTSFLLISEYVLANFEPPRQL